MYLARDMTTEDIHILHCVTPEDIQLTVPYIYMPEKYIPSNFDIDLYKKAVTELISSIDKNQPHTKLNDSLIDNYINTINTIKKDMLDNFDIRVWNNAKYTYANIDISKYKQTQIRLLQQFGAGHPYTLYIVDKIIQNLYVKKN